MFWLTYIKKLIKALNDNVSPNELAAGFVLGAIVGLIPKFNLLTILLYCVIVLLQVNISMALAATVIFAILGGLIDPISELLGFWLLSEVKPLQGLWTTLYNAPVIPFTAFNNTLVLCNFVMGLLLAVPLFLGFHRFVVVYRERYKEQLMQWPVMKAITASKLFDLYQRWINR